MEKTALITGASSGFGLLTTVTLARKGWHVIATMRDLSRRDRLDTAAQSAGVADQIEVHQLDVTNNTQIAALAALIEQRPTPLHALINNAGFAMAGFAADVTDAELRRQLDTNFFAAAAVTRALLPLFERQRFGHIVMISSISGRISIPGVSSYSASKFALEGWTEALRHELRLSGIKVVLIEPGAFETDIWTRNAVISDATQALAAAPDSPRAPMLTRWRDRVQNRTRRADPQLVADLITVILRNPKPKLRYAIGTDAWGALFAKKILPAGIFENLVYKNRGIAK
jgi:NAD(P)-dependent dehydrogenase (short-subunit alcohol dehydrogenase family)